VRQRRNDRENREAAGPEQCADEETLAYYSMLRRKPMGKHHVQICTNVACMLKGGYELLERAKKRLVIGHKETTADGFFRFERRSNASAPARVRRDAGNYDFYENLTALKFDRIMRISTREAARARASHLRGVARAHPGGTPLISKRWGIKDRTGLTFIYMHDGYQALEKALKEMTPETIIEEVKKSSLRGARWRGDFPRAMKNVVRAKDSPKPKYVICNGTNRSRDLPRTGADGNDPHQMIEGMVIAGRAIGSHQASFISRGNTSTFWTLWTRHCRSICARYLGKNILGRDSILICIPSARFFTIVTHPRRMNQQIKIESRPQDVSSPDSARICFCNCRVHNVQNVAVFPADINEALM